MSRLMELVGQGRDRAAGRRGLGMRANPLVQGAANRPVGEALPAPVGTILARGLLAQASAQRDGLDEATGVWTLGLWASSLLAGCAAPVTPDNLAAFAAWRQALPTCLPIGDHQRRAYDLRHLAGAVLPAEQAPFAAFFARVHAADAHLCQFLLKHMLQPRLAERATLREVAAFMDKQCAQRGDPCAQLARALRQHPQADAEQVEIVKLVQHWRFSGGPDGAAALPALR